jgi:UDP-N-acetylmuramyl tripeptide synthase
MAVAAAARMGVEPDVALTAIAKLTAVDARYRSTVVEGVLVRLLLAKNPAGWLEVLDIIGDSKGPVVVGINARIADGKDPSWLWDVPFERMRNRYVVAAGERSHDLAVRLHYASVEHDRQPDLHRALDLAAHRRTGGGEERVDVVANYTAFMDFTATLPDRPDRPDG